MHGKPVRLGDAIETVSVNHSRDNLKAYVEKVANTHTPLKVTRRSGDDFVVVSADDWEREQETLYVLQNSSLMQQIAQSFATHHSGYQPSQAQVNEITGL